MFEITLVHNYVPKLYIAFCIMGIACAVHLSVAATLTCMSLSFRAAGKPIKENWILAMISAVWNLANIINDVVGSSAQEMETWIHKGLSINDVTLKRVYSRVPNCRGSTPIKFWRIFNPLVLLGALRLYRFPNLGWLDRNSNEKLSNFLYIWVFCQIGQFPKFFIMNSSPYASAIRNSKVTKMGI